MYPQEKQLPSAFGSPASPVFECLLWGVILHKGFPLEEIKDNGRDCLDPLSSVPESVLREEPRCESEGAGAP